MRYTEEQKKNYIAAMEHCRSQGKTWAQSQKEVGISEKSYRDWKTLFGQKAGKKRGSKPGSKRKVQLLEMPIAASTTSLDDKLTLVIGKSSDVTAALEKLAMIYGARV